MKTALRVSKFGGTSMGSPEAMRNAAEILARDPASRVVVVSAVAGVTNQLLALAAAGFAGKAEEAARIESEIRERHDAIASGLGLVVGGFTALYRELSEIRRALADAHGAGRSENPRLLDHLLSIGERLSSELFCAHLRAEGRGAAVFDARRVIRTDDRFGRAEPDVKAIESLARQVLLPELSANELLVTQGFLGGAPGSVTTTLGRGGSDYSAALLAEAIRAEAVLIWTDVPGVFTLDPGVEPGARPIPELSFAEAAELASFGAKVLHPSTLLPAWRSNLPVFVGSTFRSLAEGTWIRGTVAESPLVRAIALRKRQTLITVTSLRMLNAQGFLARLFQILAEHHLSVDLVTTSEVSVSLTIDGASLGSGARPVRENHALLDELRAFSDVTVEDGLTLVALIGNRLTTTPGVGARALRAAEPNNVRLFCHGASAQNLCFLVEDSAAEAVARRLHYSFLDLRSKSFLDLRSKSFLDLRSKSFLDLRSKSFLAREDS